MKLFNLNLNLVILCFLGLVNNANAQQTITLRPGVAGKDAVLYNLQPNQNFGSSTELNSLAWTNSGSLVYLRSLIEFDLSAIPPGSIINSAYLSLYHDPFSSNNSGQHSSQSGSNASYIRRVTEAWSETNVNWNNQPALSPIDAAILPMSSSPNQNYLNIDVTNQVQDMANFPSKNFGFCLHLVNEDYYRCMVFSSSDHPDTSRHPMLVINYSPSNTQSITIKATDNNCDDALISSLFFEANQNFANGFESNSLSWTNGGNLVNHRTLMKFDLGLLPANITITKAKLNLFYCSSSNSNGPHSNLSGPNASIIQKINDPWSETTVTWNNQPSTSSANQSVIPSSIFDYDNYCGIDITSIINDSYNNPQSDFGFLLKLQTEVFYRRLVFGSSEHPDSLIRPELEITYLPGLTSLSESNKTSNLKIYPIPSKNTVTIEGNHSNFKGEIRLEIYDVTGRLHYMQTFLADNNGHFTYKLSKEDAKLKNGIYYVRVNHDGSSFGDKFIIE